MGRVENKTLYPNKNTIAVNDTVLLVDTEDINRLKNLTRQAILDYINDSQNASLRSVVFGNFTVYKASGNSNLEVLEIGDIVVGWFDALTFFRTAIYIGGDVSLLGSFDVIDDITI